MGKIIAIANQKGGVGKTTTSINLSSCLGALGKKVLLVDVDPQGNATEGVGIDKRKLLLSVYDVIINESKASEVIIKSEYKNLWILPSHIDLAGAEIELVSIENRETRLKNALSEVRQDYDYIILDCPPSLGLLTLNSFCASDTVLVPVQAEFYALEGISQLVKSIRQIKSLYNPELSFEGILITMYDGRTNLSLQVADEIKNYFGDKVYKTVIPRNIRLSEAPSYGQPIHIYDKTSKGAERYFELAEEVIKRNKRTVRS